MTTPTISDYLKYANLQMAAEALLFDEATNKLRTDIKAALIDGNLHASKFTDTLATDFTDAVTGWTVVAQKANTSTGFSGTLFKNNQTGELVISFRSTEFIDDAARDSRATNELEIKEKGWAFGQLSDMESWYQSLEADGKITGTISVTGYSLGGHLATAFNLMHGNDTLGQAGPKLIKEVVTFNGAGVGQIGGEVGQIGGSSATDLANLLPMILSFSGLRAEAPGPGGLQDQMQTEVGKDAYWALKALWSPGMTRPSSFAVSSILAVPAGTSGDVAADAAPDLTLLREAWRRADFVYQEAWRAPTVPSGDQAGTKPQMVLDNYIGAESLDYQLAVLVTARDFDTKALPILDGAAAISGPKNHGSVLAGANQFDGVGTERSLRESRHWRHGEASNDVCWRAAV